MSRTLSSAAIASINASETDEVWLPLIELDHGDWTDPVRLVRNTEDITSNGDVFSAFPFDVALPDDEAEQTAIVNWTAMNASNELLEIFRAVSGPISGKIMWVLASNPDLVEIGPLDLELRAFDYNAAELKGSMVIEPILDAVFGSRAMDATNAPGLI